MDLDNLELYYIRVLKEYCQSEGLKVKEKKKKDYIEVILTYNDQTNDEVEV